MDPATDHDAVEIAAANQLVYLPRADVDAERKLFRSFDAAAHFSPLFATLNAVKNARQRRLGLDALERPNKVMIDRRCASRASHDSIILSNEWSQTPVAGVKCALTL